MLAAALASLPVTALAQNARSQVAPYCFDLSRIVDLAVTKERFASIAGPPRQGDFRDTTIVWRNGRTAPSMGLRPTLAIPLR